MRGGGKVNYTSGTLARAKARSKTSQSPNRPYKRSSSALFPQKIMIPSPIRRRAATRSSIDIGTGIELYEPSQYTSSSSPMKVKKEVGSRDDWSDSDQDSARRADTSREAGHERYEEESGWWVEYGKGSKVGKQYQVELDRIMAKEQKRNRASEDNLDEKSQNVKRKSSLAVKGQGRMTAELFDRPDCLDTPHWLRLLPRKGPSIVEADEISDI